MQCLEAGSQKKQQKNLFLFGFLFNMQNFFSSLLTEMFGSHPSLDRRTRHGIRLQASGPCFHIFGWNISLETQECRTGGSTPCSGSCEVRGCGLLTCKDIHLKFPPQKKTDLGNTVRLPRSAARLCHADWKGVKRRPVFPSRDGRVTF